MMKNNLKIGFLSVAIAMLAGCSLQTPEVRKLKDISQYKYAVVAQTQNLSSGTGIGYVGYGTSGGFLTSSSKSINPSDVIAGILMKKGYIISDSVNQNATFIVRYGQGDKRNILGGLGGYTLGVTIQMLDAKTQDLIFTCSAEGQGDIEVDHIRNAIERCLESL